MTTSRRTTTEISVLDGKTLSVIGPWNQTDSATASVYIGTVSARLDRVQLVKLRDALDKVLEADYEAATEMAAVEAQAEEAAKDAALTTLHSKYRVGDLVLVNDNPVAQLTSPLTYVDQEFAGRAANVVHADPVAAHADGSHYYDDPRVVTVQCGPDADNTNYIHVASLRNISLEVREGTFPEADLAKLTTADEPPASLQIGYEVTVDGRPAKVTDLDLEDTMWPYAIEFTDRAGSDWVRPVNTGDLRVLTGEYPSGF